MKVLVNGSIAIQIKFLGMIWAQEEKNPKNPSIALSLLSRAHLGMASQPCFD